MVVLVLLLVVVVVVVVVIIIIISLVVVVVVVSVVVLGRSTVNHISTSVVSVVLKSSNPHSRGKQLSFTAAKHPSLIPRAQNV